MQQHLQKKPESDSDEEEVDTLATKSLKELKELEVLTPHSLVLCPLLV